MASCESTDKNFHLNGHIIGFRPHTQKLESPYKTPSNTLAVKGLRESGFWNPGNFCLWNQESLDLESGIQRKESGIPLRLESGIQVPLTKVGIQQLESGIYGVEFRIQNCLGFPFMRRLIKQFHLCLIMYFISPFRGRPMPVVQRVARVSALTVLQTA